MSTLQSRIEDYIGQSYADTTALTNWLTAGAKQLVNIIPIDRAIDISNTVPDIGTGIALSNYRIIKAHKSGYGA